MRKWLWSLCAGAALFCGCTKNAADDHSTPAAEAARQGIFLVGNGVEPEDLDPHYISGAPEHRVLEALFEGLVTLEPKDLSPAPGVAESWTLSPDGRVYTFKLRQNAKWSDGQPVTAHDFAYGWQRAFTPELGGKYAYLLHCVRNAKPYNEGKLKDFSKVGVRAVDDFTFQVTLEQPTAMFLKMLVMPVSYPVQKTNIERFGKIGERGTKWTRPGNLIGNGPFKLKEWKPSRYIEVERNEHYWDNATVRLKGIRFLPIEQTQTEERMFRAGELHLTNTIPPNKIEVYRRNNDSRLILEPVLTMYYYKFNTTRKPFNDRRVRLAFAMTIDRESIVRDVARGDQRAARSLTPPNVGGYTARAGIDYNPEQARQLLAEAGYPNGEGFPEIELLYNTQESHRSIAEAVQDMWKQQLNVHVALNNQDWVVYMSNVNNLDFAVTRAGWIYDYVDPSNLLECLVTGAGNNNTGYANPEFDALLLKAAHTIDANERNELFQEAEALLMRDAPLVPIFVDTKKYLRSPYVKNWNSNILDRWFYKLIELEAPAAK